LVGPQTLFELVQAVRTRPRWGCQFHHPTRLVASLTVEIESNHTGLPVGLLHPAPSHRSLRESLGSEAGAGQGGCLTSRDARQVPDREEGVL